MSNGPIDRSRPWLDRWLSGRSDELVGIRRELHSHPELGYAEHETTRRLADRLARAGLAPDVLPCGTGLVVDVGDGARTVLLRADIDALPLPDLKDVPYRSTVDGVCHACGHDAHATIALGAALALAEAPELVDGAGRVRVVFQPAEEKLPGGALRVIDAGVLAGVDRAFAVHCDPRLPAGRIGLRVGPITAACDTVEVRLSGPGGHTARPQLTVDLVDTLARVAADLPARLARRTDPRAGMSVVWGAVEAGAAPNAIPASGVLRGTVRVLDRAAWDRAGELVPALVADIARPSGAEVDVRYTRGVPPVVNDAGCVDVLRAAAVGALGEAAVVDTPQSMGAEDFAWYADHVPLALARLGVGPAAQPPENSTGDSGEPPSPAPDLHQGTFDIDERALSVGVRAMVHAALLALERPPVGSAPE